MNHDRPMTDTDANAARIAVQIQPQHCDYAEIRRLCAKLEEMGVDS